MILFIPLLMGLISLASQVVGTDHQDHQIKRQQQEEDEYYGDQPTSYFEINSLTSRFDRKLTSNQYLSYSQRAISLIAGFDTDLHRYDSNDDLINSFGRNLSYRDDLSHMRAHIDRRELELLDNQNELTLIENEQNQSKCGHQLRYLIEKIQHIMTNYTTYSRSKELDILNLMDSFGSPESELMMGNAAWFGSYQQCLDSKFPPIDNKAYDTIDHHHHQVKQIARNRYCVASFKPPQTSSNHEDERARDDSFIIKMGICLPQSCNSISILRHGEQIELLAKLVRFSYLPYNHLKLSNLYCLPDENSPLRQFTLSAKLFILTLSSWLTIVIYFSLKYEYIRMSNFRAFMMGKRTTLPRDDDDKLMRSLAFRLSFSNLFSSLTSTRTSTKPQQEQSPVVEKPQNDPLRTMEEIVCASNLLETLRGQEHLSIKAANGGKQEPRNSLAGDGSLVCVVKSSLDKSSSDLGKTINLMTPMKTPTTSVGEPKIDLSIVDGIKVVSMIWLIMAHTLLFFIRTIANGRDFWSLLRDARYLTVMAGIFPVDTFFTVTGVLTAYLKFQKHDAIGKPIYWLEALVHRYLRFMPMYALVFWYTRDVSEYIGSGPLWDYSTANTGLRSMCKQESFAVPFLFQANFKPLDQHCVKPAWYLANDYQFLLVTPIFMMLIMKSIRLGYSIIGLSIIFSLVAQFMTVFYSQEMDDFGVLVNFKPMFATYVLKNLWHLYVLPYNRIPPYLIGLLTGHLMYSKELLVKTLNETILGASDKVDETKRRKNDPVRFSSQDSNNPLPTSVSSTSLSSSSTTANNSDDDENTLGPSGSNSTSNILKRTTVASSSSSRCQLSDYLCIKVWTPLVFLISIIYLPMLTKLVTQEGLSAKIGTSSIIAFMRFVWSLAIARFIYLAATRFLESNPIERADCFIVRFLASPMWKPWSKIGLSALLIQWEVIAYLAQIQTSVPDMTITFLIASMLACILVTYLLAILIYLTVEYPLSQFEQLYIVPALFHK